MKTMMCGMNRNRRMVLLSIILGLFLCSHTSISIVQAQIDEFPIGLTMVYDIWVDHMIPPGPAYGYTMEYIVTRWIDEENLLLECNRSIDGVNDTLITTFANITLDIPGHPPLWMNVSSWTIDDIVELTGEEYQIYEMSYSEWKDGYFESYYLTNTTNGNFTHACYHSPLGVLTEYQRLSSNGSISSEVWYEMYLLDTNFDDYFPLLPPTTTTTTTTTTGTTTTTTTGITGTTEPPGSTPPTTPSISQIGEPFTGLTIVFGIGIVIEIFVIILFLRQRK